MGKSPRVPSQNEPRKSPRISGGLSTSTLRRSPRLTPVSSMQPLFASVALTDRHRGIRNGQNAPRAEVTGGLPVFSGDGDLPRPGPLQQKFVRKHTNMATKVWDPDNFVPQGNADWAPRLPRFSVKKIAADEEMPPPFSKDQPVTAPKRSVSFKRAAAGAEDDDDDGDSLAPQAHTSQAVMTDPTGRKDVLMQPTASVPLWSCRM